MTRHLRSPYLWQAVIAWTLFLASISALFFNSITAYWLPNRELGARELVRSASLAVAEEARTRANELRPILSHPTDSENTFLASIAQKVLRNYPGVEGGFYIGGDDDEFAGFAHPAEHAPPPEHAHGPHHPIRRDPPPREQPYIRLQAQQSSQAQDPTPLIQSRDVGPSRIVIGTVPVLPERPSSLVVWLMFRVTGPEDRHFVALTFQISTVLALGGLISAWLLTLNLRRRLKAGEESRLKLHEELRRSEHLASLGLMLAQVAHEVRNPLAGIRSTAQLWQRFPEMSHEPSSLQALVEAADRLDGLLTQLLNFSKPDNKAQMPVHLSRVVEETIALIHAQAIQQRIQIQLYLDANIPEVLGTESALRQVVLNLTMNALQAMPEGGQLIYRTRTDVFHGSVLLDIEDNGPGIDPNLRARLFEPFFTTRTRGTGLGLALSREIVLQHRGTIELFPAQPQGTLCRLSFPMTRFPGT